MFWSNHTFNCFPSRIQQYPTYRVFEVGVDRVEPLQVPHDSAGETGQCGAAEDGFVASLETHPLQEAVAALEHNLLSQKRNHEQRVSRSKSWQLHRVSHVFVDLGLVIFILGVPPYLF